MSGLTDARQALAHAIAAEGARAVAHPPERITPPLCIVQPADPWLSPSTERMGAYTARLDVLVVEAVATGEVATPALESTLEKVLQAADALGWPVETVRAPYMLTAGTVAYPASTVTVTVDLDTHTH